MIVLLDIEEMMKFSLRSWGKAGYVRTRETQYTGKRYWSKV